MKATCEDVQRAVRLTKTSLTEEGVRASIDRVGNEVIEFYDIDDQPKERVRALFRSKGRLADLLVVYRATKAAAATCVLVELKSSDWGDGIDQLRASHRLLAKCVSTRFRVRRWTMVLVLKRGPAPSRDEPKRRGIARELPEVRLDIVTTRHCDLRRARVLP